MENLQTFNEFVNESLNESNAYKVASKIGFSLTDAWDPSMSDYVKIVEDTLGAKAKDIQQIDEYAAEEDPTIESAFVFLQDNFVPTETLDTDEHILEYDKKLHVTRFQDSYDGFEAYQITKKSRV